jgi:hypothetical protein
MILSSRDYRLKDDESYGTQRDQRSLETGLATQFEEERCDRAL